MVMVVVVVVVVFVCLHLHLCLYLHRCLTGCLYPTQVAVGCLERGQLLDALRLRYSELLGALQLALTAAQAHADSAAQVAESACAELASARAAEQSAAAAAARAEEEVVELKGRLEGMEAQRQQREGEVEELLADAAGRNQVGLGWGCKCRVLRCI
jgi:hypothetical protein